MISFLLPSGDQEFAKYLLDLGDGKIPILRDRGEFKTRIRPELIIKGKSVQNLCDFVFPDLKKNHRKGTWLASRAIICPTNAEVDSINEVILKNFPGEERVYRSSDHVEENCHNYPMEFINKLTPPGIPPHRLVLKEHSCVMLLRNLDSANGHTNGTRYIVNSLHPHLIEATVAIGPHAGKKLLIPRIPFVPTESTYPFHMKRMQLPVRAGFAITANKGQGQSLDAVGILLRRQFFAHGQMFVAQSRVGSAERLGILTDDDTCDYVVYPEVL